jgi:hypothetical protein
VEYIQTCRVCVHMELFTLSPVQNGEEINMKHAYMAYKHEKVSSDHALRKIGERHFRLTSKEKVLKRSQFTVN